MTKVQALIAAIEALKAERDKRLHHQPTDMVAVTQITEKILDLTARLTAMMNGPSLPPLSGAQVQAIQSAVTTLGNAVAANAAVTAILVAATELAHVVANG